MDLNTALMESISNITSMSEYFVAANTRTSFTDLAESSGSMSSLVSHSTTSSNHQPSSANHHQLSQSTQQQFTNNNTVHKNITGPQMEQLQQQQQQQQQQLPHLHPHLHQQNHQLNLHPHVTTNSAASLNSLSTCIQNHNHHFNNQTYSSSGTGSSCNTLTNNCSNNMQTRSSQPMRTQIPIHCYIEHLDACAEIPTSFAPTMTDNELFNTSNILHTSGNLKTTTNLNQSNNHDHTHQPHLHQSKLALESVTNCNGSPTNLGSVTSSNILFDETDTNTDNNDLDAVDARLDHLSTGSPLSIHQQNNTNLANSNIINNNINSNSNHSNNLASSTNRIRVSAFDGNTFQSCKETFAIVTSNVLYIDLLRTVLLQLGFSAMDLINAKATIQIKNWKPLALDQVTEDKRATVGEVLGDISTFVSLRIRLYSPVTQLPTDWNETMIRQVVLALTQTMSQLTLSKLCNISQPLISSIVRGGKKLGRRKCAEFGQWYMNYIKSAEARPSTLFCEGGGARLVFDKSREIPLLKTWFAENTKPSDDLLEAYSKELNQHALRKDRPQVTAKALKNWWKNERQKLGIRQREFRGRPKLKRID